jgi:hypothetical protein
MVASRIHDRRLICGTTVNCDRFRQLSDDATRPVAAVRAVSGNPTVLGRFLRPYTLK